MKLLNQVKKIIENHPWEKYKIPEGYANLYQYLNEDIKRRSFPEYSSPLTDNILCNKYKINIPKGWYGFDIGNPIHPEWIEIIDEVLQLCIANDEDLQIHQVKIKYGGIRFYVESLVIEDMHEIEYLVEDLYDKALIY